MENNLVETIFEAITLGDETIVEQCMQQATIDTVLEFRRAYGESPLHLCVKIGGMSHLGAVRCLLASGLFDNATVDSEGQTVLGCAFATGDNKLVEALIKIEIDGLDDATACYKMFRHDSLPIFKLFLLVRQFTEEEEFQHIARALIQLKVKNVHLSQDLRLFALWKLSDYGFRRLSGDWPGTKDPNEWKHHIDVISDCWRVISARYDTRLYADVDDQLLHRLQTVHNHLYLLKHKQFLAHLPMQEVLFCLAIFLSIYHDAEHFLEYRLMVNKCLVIEFVRMFSKHLATVKTYLVGTETELLAIVREIEASGTAEKSKLIDDILVKFDSSELPNKAHVRRQLMERVARGENKDSIIKDMLDKVKRIDKPWTEKMAVKVKALDTTNREQLIGQIGKRLRHVSHPQNVVNRLMGDWKKGKATEFIVAEIVSGESFNLSHLMCGKERRIKRNLQKCYTKTRQYYSLHKTLYYCENLVRERNEANAKSTYAEVACMKRTVQVFGESIKNTTNSANMPGKVGNAVHVMLTSLFPDINKLFREVISHSVSLKKLLVKGSHERILCDTFRSNLGMMRMVFQLLFVVAVSTVRQSFYGHMRQCDTFRELRSLMLYVGDMQLFEERQRFCYKEVIKYFDEAKTAFKELEKEPIGKMPTFQVLRDHWQIKRGIVETLDECFTENDGFSYNDIRRACFSSDDLAAVRRLLDWKLTLKWSSDFFRKVNLSWHTKHVESLAIEWRDQRLLKYNPSVIAGILKNGTAALECVEEFDYIVHARRLTHDLRIADQIDEEALQQLNQRLKSYYNDIFFIDNKWKVLEAFCKERKLPWDKQLARELVKRDQAHLQQLYDDARGKVRQILERFGLDTVDGLVTRLYHLPTQMLSALEYIQLELCEMLYAVGHFGDSFHYLKSRIPMIQGKNYRNFLAHDTVSYNLLTDSSMEKIVINAFVFANTEVQLFGSGSAVSKVDITVPTLSDMHEWVAVQERLLDAFTANDIQGMHSIGAEGGEMKGRFCCTPNKAHVASAFFHLPSLINPCDPARTPVAGYLDQYFAGFLDQCNEPAYQVTMALKLRDYRAVFDRTIARGDRVIREELFGWEELMAHVRKTDLFIHLVAVVNRGAILKKLIEYGNTAGVREMLPYFEAFHTPNDRGPLGDALLYCVRSVADLLQRTVEPHPAVLLLAMMVHWNDIFTQLMDKAVIDRDFFKFLLKTAVQAGNYTAVVYLLENEAFQRFIPGIFDTFPKFAASLGDYAALLHLLVRCPPATRDAKNSLADALHQAAQKQHWNCAQLLLEHGVPADVRFPQKLQERNCTLVLFVEYGQSRLLQKIKSINRERFGEVAKQAFTRAVQSQMTSARMVRALRALGFDWLDNAATLYEAIRTKNKDAFETIRKLINEQCAMNPTAHLDYFRHALIVLQRWKMISFVEESKSHSLSSFFSALNANDKTMVEDLFNWARQMRTIEELGILRGIVFERETVFTCFGKRNEGSSWNTRDSCEDMIIRMETCALLGEMIWQEFTLNANSTPVTLCVLTAEDEMLEPLQNQTFTLRDSGSLVEQLQDMLEFVNAKLGNYAVVFAKFSTTDGATRCFWQIEQISCLYDILPPSENGVDLTDTVNYRDMLGETPLHHCFPKDSLEMVRLMVENGANPLLADSSGMAPIHLSLLNTQDYAVGRYLFDESVRRDLRNEKGCSVLELDDGSGGNRLIHTAVMSGRQDIVQRLLQLHADVTVVNGFGFTPAHFAMGINIYNMRHIVKMILDYDPSIVDTSFNHMDETMLQTAARTNSLELVQLILRYKPDFKLNRNGMTALGLAVLLKHTTSAKCLIRYAIENNIQDVTQVGEDDDLVLLSLFSNDYELSKMLLEHDLGHSMKKIDERDLPRIKSILEGTLSELPDVPIAQVVERQRFIESENFLQELRLIATSILEQ